MKRETICLMIGLALISLASCEPAKYGLMPVNIEITQGWEFRQAGTETWLQAKVPGSVHTDLGNNQLIPDPFYRLNEKDLQWIDKVDWEYRTVISADAGILKNQHIRLEFEGLDTYADIFLNDEPLLQTDNMFRTYRADVKGIMKEGQNTLLIRFRSPTLTGREKLKDFGFQLAADNDQSETGGMGADRVSPYVRKAPYHFGWDWGPRLVTSGIWRPVRLVAWDEVKIEEVWVKILDINEENARLEVVSTLNADQRGQKAYAVYINDSLISSRICDLEPGMNEAKVEVLISRPRLWWPNGMGEQNLYRVRVEIHNKGAVFDKQEVGIGLRHAELVQEPDPEGDGRSFYFRINGKPVFAKGANYIPNDVFLNRVSRENYEFIVKSAAEANMNMLRVWGGGIYENDIFYALCDRYGIMVWQDFMFACAMYPGNDEFLESVRLEAIDNVRRLRNHPSVVLWCGNNEIEAAWGPYDENRGWGWKQRYSPEQREVIWKAYDTLFHHILPGVVALEDPQRPYWHSSPSAGMGKLASYESNSGDMHYWGVWHGQHPFSDFRKYRARFMSEYGFQSFPEYHSVKRFTLPEDHFIESDVMMAHQRSGIGNLRIKEYMAGDYIVPGDFSAFLYVSQLLQAEAIGMAISAHRSDMPYCMGSLYWQLNDCWPAASWSGIDYYGKWKALHYFVRDAYKPVKLVVKDQDEIIQVRIISDTYTQVSSRLEMRLISFDGEVLWSDRGQFNLPPGLNPTDLALNRKEVLQGFDPASVVLVSSLTGPAGLLDMSYHYFVKPKSLKLKDPGLTYEISEREDHFEIRLSVAGLAKNAFLSAEGLMGQFSDNFFDIAPGEVVSVKFPKTSSREELEKNLKIQHLFSTLKRS